jgi:hypothetical protein
MAGGIQSMMVEDRTNRYNIPKKRPMTLTSGILGKLSHTLMQVGPRARLATHTDWG